MHVRKAWLQVSSLSQTCFCSVFFNLRAHITAGVLNSSALFPSLTLKWLMSIDNDYLFPVWHTWPFTTQALLEERSPGKTVPWTWRGGIDWAVRSPAFPCPAPVPQRRMTHWITSTSTSDSPVVSSKRLQVPKRGADWFFMLAVSTPFPSLYIKPC